MEGARGKQLMVLGIGNEAMADDGLGVEIVRELGRRRLPEGVRTAILGPDPLDLLLLDSRADGLVIVDAIVGDGQPGTLRILSVDDILGTRASNAPSSLHQVGLQETFRLAKAMGLERTMPIVVVGIEAGAIQPGAELSPGLAGTFPAIVDAVAAEIAKLLRSFEKNHGQQAKEADRA